MRRGVLIVGNFLSAHVMTRSVCEELSDRLEGAGWDVVRASSKLNRIARLGDMLKVVWRERRRYEVAQVDVYSGRAFVWAELVCGWLRLLGKRYVLTLHGGNLPEFGERRSRRVRKLLESAVVVTTPSPFLQEKMRKFRGELELLPNALDLTKYRFRDRREGHRVIWLRAFHEIYNPALAVRVVAEALKKFPAAVLSMVGPDKGDGSLEAARGMARELGLEEAVTFPGGVQKREVPDWLDRHDLFLNTPNVDNTPVCVLEAMASGLPVVSTRVGGIPYLVEGGVNGVLAGAGDAAGLAGAMERIWSDAEWRRQLVEQGRRSVEKFDWGTVLPRWEGIFRRVGKWEGQKRHEPEPVAHLS